VLLQGIKSESSVAHTVQYSLCRLSYTGLLTEYEVETLGDVCGEIVLEQEFIAYTAIRCSVTFL
jgi:hypothetical protein